MALFAGHLNAESVCVVTLPLTINETRTWLSLPGILIQNQSVADSTALITWLSLSPPPPPPPTSISFLSSLTAWDLGPHQSLSRDNWSLNESRKRKEQRLHHTTARQFQLSARHLQALCQVCRQKAREHQTYPQK